MALISSVNNQAKWPLQLTPLGYASCMDNSHYQVSFRLTEVCHGHLLQAGGDLTASRSTFFLQLGLRSAAAGNFPAALDR